HEVVGELEVVEAGVAEGEGLAVDVTGQVDQQHLNGIVLQTNSPVLGKAQLGTSLVEVEATASAYGSPLDAEGQDSTGAGIAAAEEVGVVDGLPIVIGVPGVVTPDVGVQTLDVVVGPGGVAVAVAGGQVTSEGELV
ncbi:hypothetical protein BW246_08910, partial [Helicobacter pylori]